MNRNYSRCLFLLIGIVLMVGIVPQLLMLNVRGTVESAHLPALLDIIPRGSPSVEVIDLPLEATETLQRAVLNLLRPDLYLYRQYSARNVKFCVYAAYWWPDTMWTAQTSGHNPDNCWPAQGWQPKVAWSNVSFGAGLRRLDGGEQRVFLTPKGETVNVAFWHFVGGVARTRPPPVRIVESAGWWCRNVIADLYRGRQEQIFVRISSASTFEELATEPEFQEIVRCLAQFVKGPRMASK